MCGMNANQNIRWARVHANENFGNERFVLVCPILRHIQLLPVQDIGVVRLYRLLHRQLANFSQKL